ncbi:unnamed protein product [Protopolystoma xenopodis]|uniref:Uncharacterized protein n=1 Tax=Protopolystoma xenopodis TaxID=117903 RepID=A0A3S5BN67_9PLAT|nr:unnamed protein product [Protopolystoma xenopodis]
MKEMQPRTCLREADFEEGKRELEMEIVAAHLAHQDRRGHCGDGQEERDRKHGSYSRDSSPPRQLTTAATVTSKGALQEMVDEGDEWEWGNRQMDDELAHTKGGKSPNSIPFGEVPVEACVWNEDWNSAEYGDRKLRTDWLLVVGRRAWKEKCAVSWKGMSIRGNATQHGDGDEEMDGRRWGKESKRNGGKRVDLSSLLQPMLWKGKIRAILKEKKPSSPARQRPTQQEEVSINCEDCQQKFTTFPQQFDKCSAIVPQQFHNSSPTVQQQFNKSSTTVRQMFHISSTTVPQQVYNSYTTVSQQLHNKFTTVPHQAYNSSTKVYESSTISLQRFHNRFITAPQQFNHSPKTFPQEVYNGSATVTQQFHNSSATVTQKVYNSYTKVRQMIHESSTTVKQQFNYSSTVVLQQVYDSSTTGLRQFHNSSATFYDSPTNVPQQFNHSSTTVPQQLNHSPKTFPQEVYNGSTRVPQEFLNIFATVTQ